jgi:sterol desaturase/sphingolipid hydroxylase (fatty acid hydroxylase superfamily)
MVPLDPAIYVIGLFVLIPLGGMTVGYLMQRLKSQERLRAIEKGVLIPPDPVRSNDPWKLASALRLGGTVLIAVGLGVLVLLVALAASLPEFPRGVIAVSAIPTLIGVALLIEHRVRSRELGPRPNSSANSSSVPRPDGTGL